MRICLNLRIEDEEELHSRMIHQKSCLGGVEGLAGLVGAILFDDLLYF